MSPADTLRDIDRLFQSAACNAASATPTATTPPYLAPPARKLAAVAALATAAAVHAQGPVVYVDDDAPPGGDGASWQTAFRSLQDALDDVHTHRRDDPLIKIAGGTYRPSATIGAVHAAFELTTSGVTLQGGFAGFGHADPDLHDPAAFVSVLSGDIAGDDGPNFANRADNADSVLYVHHCSHAWIRDLTFYGSSADDHGRTGAGIYCPENISLGLRNCRFRDHSGPALFATAWSPVTLFECTIEGNRRAFGGATVECPTLVAFRCVFRGNTAIQPSEFDAAVIRGDWTGSLQLDECLVAGAPSAGSTRDYGPLFSRFTTITIRTCTLVTATVDQPVLDADNSDTIVGTILSGPFGEPTRLGRYRVGNLAVERCCLSILDGDLNAQAGTLVKGPGVIFANPRFVSPGGADGLIETYADNDYRLAPSSPAIDLCDTSWIWPDSLDLDHDGDTTEPLPIDLSGAPRIHDDPGTPNLGVGFSSALDLGPYEFQGTSCRADYDASGLVGVGDIFTFLHDWFIVSPDADFNRSGAADLGDIFDFLAAYFAGCP